MRGHGAKETFLHLAKETHHEGGTSNGIVFPVMGGNVVLGAQHRWMVLPLSCLSPYLDA